MGIFDRLGLTRKRFDELSTTGYASPWRDNPEDPFNVSILDDLLGGSVDELPLTREAAIAIPAVSKARNLLVSTVAKFPLVALNEAGAIKKQPAWLYRTNGLVSPYERMAWTIDDCIFNGVALWITERSQTADSSGRREILDAQWCPPRDWKITNGNILVNDKPVDDQDIILFNPPFEGLLNIGRRTLRGARDIELAWTARIKNPIYLTELDITDDSLTQTEVDAWEAAWTKKHRAGEPSIGVTPAGSHIVTHGGENSDASMFMESRNAIRTDVGSFLNVRASMLDGTAGIDSLTYTTTAGERNAFYEFDLPFWTDPIEAALSQDKCVPRGTRVRFDKYELYAPTPSPTGAPEKD